MNKENLKLKVRYYLVPQALVTLFIAFYPVYMTDLFNWIYAVTGVEFFRNIALPQVCVIGLITCIIAYVGYAKTGIFLLKFSDKKWERRAISLLLPIFIGCLCMGTLKLHLEHLKFRSYSIANINELRNIHDSTEVYTIEYYNIVYDEYFYTEGVEDVDIGSSKHRQYITEVYTYAVCPVLVNFSTELDLKKQKVWIGFYISNRFKSRYDHDSQIVKDAAYENLTKLHAQDEIVYFTETTDETYKNLIKEKLENNSIPYNDMIILEAHYTPYMPYDGYQYALITLYCFLVGNILLTIGTLIADIDEEKKKKLLSNQNAEGTYSK